MFSDAQFFFYAYLFIKILFLLIKLIYYCVKEKAETERGQNFGLGSTKVEHFDVFRKIPENSRYLCTFLGLGPTKGEHF